MASEPTASTDMGRDLQLGEDRVRAVYADFYRTTLLFARLRLPVRLLDAVAGAVEGVRCGRMLDRPLDRPIFILGNFRSGTTLVEQIVCQHPETGSFNYGSQVLPRSPALARWIARTFPFLDPKMRIPHQPHLRVDGADPFEGEVFWRWCRNNYWSDHETNVLDATYDDPAFEAFFRAQANKHLRVQGRSRFVNKNPWNTLRIGYLSRIFPDARFVYVVRHPERMLRSQVDMEAIFGAIFRDVPGLNAIVSDQFLPPRAFFRTREHRRIVAAWQEDPLLGSAHAIDDFDLTFQEERRKLDGRAPVHVLRYEDLLADGEGTVRALLRFLELDGEPGDGWRTLLAADLVSRSNPPRVPDEARRLLDRMKADYGYA